MKKIRKSLTPKEKPAANSKTDSNGSDNPTVRDQNSDSNIDAMNETDGWRFLQVFGDKGQVEEISEVDLISTVTFDDTGEFLATGDKGGRVVLFDRNNSKNGNSTFNFFTEFQSHEPEFDYLKSLEIEEKINKIQWLKRQNEARFLLSSNDKTIKLWKIYDQKVNAISDLNTIDNNGNYINQSSVTSLRVPKLTPESKNCTVVPRRTYAHAHQYHINSVSINSDDETFLSSDDLRVNLWNMEINKESFNIVDIKPANMEELTEVITAAEFHPVSCNTFAYSSSKGTIKVCDMRDAALCETHTKLYEEEDSGAKSFFSEIITSISDIKFSRDGHFMMSRDYLTVKIWDLRQEKLPVKKLNVHDYLRTKLCDLYENDCIFDKFECTWAGDNKSIMTGSYNNMFTIFDRQSGNEICMEAAKLSVSKKSGGFINPNFAMKFGKRRNKPEINVDQLNFNQKVMHSDWHPTQNLIAVAATNNLYIYAKN